jgi:tRNA uridine 5-carboxymethylaminomethyl modification enzyme
LIDDLATKGTNEPYRMFTSRVEYRLLLREDNADLRLRRFGYDIGLVSEEELHMTEEKEQRIARAIKGLKETRIKPTDEMNKALIGLNTSPVNKAITAAELLRRPQVAYGDLIRLNIISDSMPKEYEQIVELLVKYDGFIKRQAQDVRKMQDIEKIRLPANINFSSISGLSKEIVEKLDKVRPISLGQASRISGITPAAIMLLIVYLKKRLSSTPACRRGRDTRA